jgi:WD40 repeat protein
MNFAKHWAATLDDYVIDLAWSPDGSLLAVASAAGGITLYDAMTGVVKHALAGHADGANCLAWMPVAGRVVPDEPRPPSAHPASVAKAMEPKEDSPYLLATGGQDGCVRFWDASTGQQTAEAKLGAAWVEHLAWKVGRVVPDEPRAATARPEDSPYLFASAGRKLVALRPDGSIAHTFPDAPKTISALAISPVGRVIPNAPSSSADEPRRIRDNPPYLAAAYFGGVCLWNIHTFAADKELPYGNAILALTWSPDGRWLVAGCHDNAVHLWVPAEDLELQMSGYETKLKELSFSRDSKWLATGGGRDACIWDCTGAGPEGREPLLLPHQARVCAVAFQNEHGLLATASADGEFCLWSPSRKNPVVAEVKLPATATKFAWRADDTLLAVGTEKGTVYVFKTE